MKPFYAATALLTGVLATLTFYYRSEPDTFYGIADTKEIVINSESPVEIQRILVAQGQIVAKGDTLLELRNPELDLKINQLTHELSVLKTRKSTHATLSRSEIRQLQAQQQERVGEIRAEIRELEAQYNLNRQLISELRSLEKDGGAADKEDESRNPLKVKIESLKRMLELAQDPSRIYVDRLSHALSSDGDPLIEEAHLLEEELGLLMEDRRRLVIPAQIDGLIGSVNFKVGEKVSPFAPILTLHAAAPSFVRGYIHEDVMSKVALSQTVIVRSGHDRRNRIEGEIVGVGARIVEYPERLRKRADILIWGREIIVRLPAGNRFLLGEKVMIALSDRRGPPGAVPSADPGPGIGAGVGKATPSADTVAARDIRPGAPAMAGFYGPPADVPGIEASGLLFLEDLGKFLVISDESEKDPALYLMDTAARIEKKAPIGGLDAMDDMEAIAADSAGAVYVLSSQSRTKKGKLPEKRTLLVRLARKGEALSLQAKVRLMDLFREAARLNPGEEWARFLRDGIADGSLDIEGMAVHGDGLLLGFKAPLHKGKAVILRLGGIDGVMAGKGIQGRDMRIWNTPELKSPGTGTACGISDLHMAGDDLYILSTGVIGGGESAGKEAHAGDLWVLGNGGGKPRHMRDFGGMKAEGVARHGSSGLLYVAIDNGSGKPSQILKTGTMP